MDLSKKKTIQMQEEEANLESNANIVNQIEVLEKQLTRPMRELLATSTPKSYKDIAQAKIDAIEADIVNLRATIQ